MGRELARPGGRGLKLPPPQSSQGGVGGWVQAWLCEGPHAPREMQTPTVCAPQGQGGQGAGVSFGLGPGGARPSQNSKHPAGFRCEGFRGAPSFPSQQSWGHQEGGGLGERSVSGDTRGGALTACPPAGLASSRAALGLCQGCHLGPGRQTHLGPRRPCRGPSAASAAAGRRARGPWPAPPP